MCSRPKLIGILAFFGSGLPLIASLLLMGCQSDPNTVVVDFSKKANILQPAICETNPNALRVAVASITSPKQTMIVYHELLRYVGETADHFFSKTFYTYSHDNSIMAVARSLIDGAFVHEQIWEYFRHQDPDFTAQTRVIFQSEPFGNPPVVASFHLPAQTIERIKHLLYNLHLDPQGKSILAHLMIERFVPVKEELYEPIRRMVLTLNTQGASQIAYEKSAH